MNNQLLSDLVQPVDLPCVTIPTIENFIAQHLDQTTEQKQEALLNLLQHVDQNLTDTDRIHAINTIQ